MSCSGGNRRAAGEPVGELGVGQLQHRLHRVELGLAHGRDPRSRRSRRPAGRSRGCRDGWRGRGCAGVWCRGRARRACCSWHGIARHIESGPAPVSPCSTIPRTPFRTCDRAARRRAPPWPALIERLAPGGRVLDLLFHLPESYIDRRLRPTHPHARSPARWRRSRVEVVRHEEPANPRQPWRVIVTDGTGFAELVFFGPQRLRQFPVGARSCWSRARWSGSATGSPCRIRTMRCRSGRRRSCRRSSRSGR